MASSRCIIVVVLSCLTLVSLAEEPKKDADAGRDLRKMFLTMPAKQAGIEPTSEYPRVWGIAVDWPIGQHIATVVSLADGSASVYTTGTFGIIGGIGHETVRTAAKKLVKEADRYYSDSTPTNDLSYPRLDQVRFFLVTFEGVRVVNTSLASVTEGRGKYSTLFDLAQDVIRQLRLAGSDK